MLSQKKSMKKTRHTFDSPLSSLWRRMKIQERHRRWCNCDHLLGRAKYKYGFWESQKTWQILDTLSTEVHGYGFSWYQALKQYILIYYELFDTADGNTKSLCLFNDSCPHGILLRFPSNTYIILYFKRFLKSKHLTMLHSQDFTPQKETKLIFSLMFTNKLHSI